MTPGISEAYLSGEAGGFFREHFSDPAARRASVARVTRALDPALLSALAAQNANLAPSQARDRHLEALRTGAAAVVTGQQVGLFLGPLYTLYKAMTAVSAAKRLEAETGTKVVPVFWVQSEDHDLAEVAEVVCPSASKSGEGPVTLRLAADGSDRISLVHQRLPPELESCFEQLSEALAGLPFAGAHLSRLRRHYRVGGGYAEAFIHLLAELTAELGLVFINPRHPSIAPFAAPVHRRAILDRSKISDALEARGRALDASGFSAPVHVRPGAPLSFFHPDGAAGPRFRLSADGEMLTLVGRDAARFTESELLAQLDRDPMAFSTSALLRPILEAQLLPTAMYVGGPGEVAYFAQVQPLYDAFDSKAPIVLPRARLLVVEPEVQRSLARVGVSAAEVSMGTEALLARLAPATGAPRASEKLRAEVLGETMRNLEARREILSPLGPGLDRALDRTQKSIEVALGRFIRKVERAELHRNDEDVERVRRLQDALFPDGQPQERVFGFSRYAARYGEGAFLEAILRAFDPFRPGLSEVHP